MQVMQLLTRGRRLSEVLQLPYVCVVESTEWLKTMNLWCQTMFVWFKTMNFWCKTMFVWFKTMYLWFKTMFVCGWFCMICEFKSSFFRV